MKINYLQFVLFISIAFTICISCKNGSRATENTILTQNESNQSIKDKKWQLVELNGKSVQGSPETHYIIFHSTENRLEAKANCNVLLNNYTIQNQLQISIKAGISTMMACEDNLEQEFSAMLLKADNLSVNGNTLTLNKARMAPLARFKLVVE